jgi:hypothetical protein
MRHSVGWAGPLTVMVVLAPVTGEAQAQDADRIFARVRTAAGETYEGTVRWDRNEGSWADLLDGIKDLDAELLEWVTGWDEEDARERSIEFLGIRITWNDDDDDLPSSAESGIRFGHLRSLRVTGDDHARLTLKSGEEMDWRGGSTDLGEDMRALLVHDPTRGLVELRWRDLDRVDFMAAPGGALPEPERRLYGTVTDRWGNRHAGLISWDLDEILTSDLLDGKEGGREREIPFGTIRAIERLSSGSSRVTLEGGETLVLEGTNDVGRGHRGVQISDPGLGRVEVRWGEFASVRFEPVPDGFGYDVFDGGHRLRGTVLTEDGESFTGGILWDADESRSWEMLDGSWRDIVFDVEFGAIATIEKRSSRSAEVVLLDGRSFELEGSNDVDRDNKGIVIEVDGGDPVLIRWDRFASVTFDHRR